jgi:hypothetical protein
MSQRTDSLPLPKLNLRELSVYFADLWLVSDNSVEWVKEPRVRRVWQIYFFSACFIMFVRVVVVRFVEPILMGSSLATLVWRWFSVLGMAWMLVTTVLLTSYYYRFLMLVGKDVRFRNIVVFWCTWVSLFGILYRDLYNLKPSLYSFSNPALIPQVTFVYLGLLINVKLGLQFLLYSACATIDENLPGLSSSSFLVSGLNLVEAIGSLLLAGLLLATFVNKSATSKR